MEKLVGDGDVESVETVTLFVDGVSEIVVNF